MIENSVCLPRGFSQPVLFCDYSFTEYHQCHITKLCHITVYLVDIIYYSLNTNCSKPYIIYEFAIIIDNYKLR